MQLTSSAADRGFLLSPTVVGLPDVSCAAPLGDGSLAVAAGGGIYRYADRDGQPASHHTSYAALPGAAYALSPSLLTTSAGVYSVLAADPVLGPQVSDSAAVGLAQGSQTYVSSGSSVSLLDTATGGLSAVVSASGTTFHGLALSPDGSLLYATDGQRLEVRRTSDGSLAAQSLPVSGAVSVALGSGVTAGLAYVYTGGSLYEVSLGDLSLTPALILSGGAGSGQVCLDRSSVLLPQDDGLYRLTLPLALSGGGGGPAESYSTTSGPALRLARRVPRGPGEAARTVPLAYVDVPAADPGRSVAIVDTGAGSAEDVFGRSAAFTYTGESSVAVLRDAPDVPYAGRTYGPLADPSPGGGFVLPANVQHAATSPVRVLRVEADPAGGWHPVLSRGLFYQVLTMRDDVGSWLQAAGFQPGQTLLCAYTTEMDWSLRSAGTRGTGASGGGSLAAVRAPVPLAQSSRRVSLLTSGRLLSLGGLATSSGVELLTESGSASEAPGDGTGALGSWSVSAYRSTYSDPTQGRVRAAAPVGSGLLAQDTLAAGVLNADLLAPLTGAADPATVVVRLSGSLYVAQEGFRSVTVTMPGKVRMFHWGVPVVDRWYGAQGAEDTTPRATTYAAYLHAGWHDFAVEIGPESYADGSDGGVSLATDMAVCSGATSRSQVESIDLSTGAVTLRGGFVGRSDTLEASLSYTSGEMTYRGFSDTAWHGLDLNPSFGRTYGSGRPTSDWLEDTCVLWAVPSMACALTDAGGNPLTGGLRNWVSCATYVKSTLQWGSISGRNTLLAGTSALPFGASSSFGGGDAPYSAQGAAEGLASSALTDPRGPYLSGFVLAHLTVSDALPDPSAVRVFDLRSRGGGLSHEDAPRSLRAAGARERAETFWDLSPWEGSQASPAGRVLVRIPRAYLTGSDGLPQWTEAEIAQIVGQSVAAGLEPLIEYI